PVAERQGCGVVLLADQRGKVGRKISHCTVIKGDRLTRVLGSIGRGTLGKLTCSDLRYREVFGGLTFGVLMFSLCFAETAFGAGKRRLTGLFLVSSAACTENDKSEEQANFRWVKGESSLKQPETAKGGCEQGHATRSIMGKQACKNESAASQTRIA